MDDLQANFFNAYLCHVCKTRESFKQSKLCSACKLISYCSKEHQKADWRSHKIMCKATQELCRSRPGDDLFDVGLKEMDSTFYNELGWIVRDKSLYDRDPGLGTKRTYVRISVRLLMEKHFKRDLGRVELHMIFFPQHCAVCFTRKNIQKELVCTNCFGVAYCSAEHKSQDDHRKLCTEIRKALDMDFFMLDVAPKIQKLSLNAPRFQLLKPGQDINFKTCDMKSFITKYIKPGLKFEEEVLVSIHYTWVLTFAYMISRIPNFTLPKRLTIHLVGAHGFCEGEVLRHWENVLHLFPRVGVVTLVHISPCISGPPDELDLCLECVRTNRSVHYSFHHQHYHEYYNNADFVKPDVVIAFNSGLFDHQTNYDPWGPTLPFFFKYNNVPVILTEAIKWEAERDRDRLRSGTVVGDKKLCIVVDCEKNPFKNLRPWRSWDDPDNEIRYKNTYVSVLIVEGG